MNLPSGFRAHVANIGIKDATDDFTVVVADREAAMAILEPTLVELGYLARPEARS
jgi:N-acetylglutamate synthase/N-acetylornithine aminotransferase